MNHPYIIALKGENNSTHGIICVPNCTIADINTIDHIIAKEIKTTNNLINQMDHDMLWTNQILFALRSQGFAAFEIQIDNYFEVE